MKVQNAVENIARLTAEKLGEGWNSQDTILGAQVTGPGGARICMDYEADLVHVHADAPPEANLPEGRFTQDAGLVAWFVCNALHQKYMAYLADAREEAVELQRWQERSQAAIEHFAASAGVRAPLAYCDDDRVKATFAAHGCQVDISTRYLGEDVIQIIVPKALDLGNLSLTWNYETEKTPV